MVYAKNFHPDEYNSFVSSGDENCVVFDPDNIRDSSTSLSAFLERYEREDWTPPVRKLRKTPWVWTSDEDNDTNSHGASMPDIGYITKSKTFCSSDSESDSAVSRPRRLVKKRKTTKKVVHEDVKGKADTALARPRYQRQKSW